MKTITGCKTKNGAFKMHSPNFPYTSVTYIGYTEEQMKRKYRSDFGLERKHLEWIILG